MLEELEASAFDLWWQVAAEPVVRAYLRQQRCQEHDIDDITQLTSVKAWQTPKVFDDVEHFVAWCCTVANSRRVDEWRKVRREWPGEIPELPAADDPEDLALNLVTRDEMRGVIDTLPPKEREAVLGYFTPRDTVEANAMGVARHRGRAKLRPTWERLLGAAFGGYPARVMARASRAVEGMSPQAAAALVATAAIALGIGVTSVRPTRPIPPGTVRDASASVKEAGHVRGSSSQHSASRSDATATRSPSARPNNTPVPRMSLPFIPAPDGSPQRIKIEPSTPEKSGQHVCFATMATPYRCIETPFQSIDYWFPALPIPPR